MITLTTERLILRQLSAKDAARLAHIANDFDVAKTTLSMPHPYTLDDALSWIKKVEAMYKEGKSMELGLFLKSNEHLIGCVGLINISLRHAYAELGYFYW